MTAATGAEVSVGPAHVYLRLTGATRAGSVLRLSAAEADELAQRLADAARASRPVSYERPGLLRTLFGEGRMIRETCSCGASTEVDYGGEQSGPDVGRNEADAVSHWRETHRHDAKPAHECDDCGADLRTTPECEHQWVDETGMVDVDRTLVCKACGTRQTMPEAHAHNWDHGPKDFGGPARCRICGVKTYPLADVAAEFGIDLNDDLFDGRFVTHTPECDTKHGKRQGCNTNRRDVDGGPA